MVITNIDINGTLRINSFLLNIKIPTTKNPEKNSNRF